MRMLACSIIFTWLSQCNKCQENNIHTRVNVFFSCYYWMQEADKRNKSRSFECKVTFLHPWTRKRGAEIWKMKSSYVLPAVMMMTEQRKQRERRRKRSWERFRETRWAQRNRAQGPGGIWNIHQDINYPLFSLFKWEVMRLWFMAFVLRPVCLSVCPSVCLTFVYLQRGSFGFTWRPTVKL